MLFKNAECREDEKEAYGMMLMMAVMRKYRDEDKDGLMKKLWIKTDR